MRRRNISRLQRGNWIRARCSQRPRQQIYSESDQKIDQGNGALWADRRYNHGQSLHDLQDAPVIHELHTIQRDYTRMAFPGSDDPVRDEEMESMREGLPWQR